MSIEKLNFEEFYQDFGVEKEDKYKYGEIYTPFSLIKNMFSMFHADIFKNKDLKWLDSGAGSGYFSIFLYYKLYTGLELVFPCKIMRHNHIINNMIYMVEIKENNIDKLEKVFGIQANIIHCDYLAFEPDFYFDVIIGNPPYNSNGIKKVPTNNKKNKKEDGITIWDLFIKKSTSLLKSKGKLLYIVPSIWMKPDRSKMYYYILQFRILKLHCLTNTETNTYFKGNAQTPTCYFLLSNELCHNLTIDLYDKCREKYVNYSFTLDKPIPLFGQSIIKKLQKYVDNVGCIKVYKTNLPSKVSLFSNKKSDLYLYENVKTCHLTNLQPKLIKNYSNVPQSYFGVIKLILSHKMYGFPFIDLCGKYGISNRDNYVIINYTTDKLKQLQKFLNTKFALYVYEAARYRMSYLEKYAFEFLPDITKLLDFPTNITDESIAAYFNLDDIDINNILALNKKNYIFY